jgi:hypothetical protein
MLEAPAELFMAHPAARAAVAVLAALVITGMFLEVLTAVTAA